MSTLGQGSACYVLKQDNSGTTPLVSSITLPTHSRAVTYQLVTDLSDQRNVTVTGADAVVASSHTWTFANGAFTSADVGGTITVTGAAQANNNGTFTIASVTNGTTIVTGGTQTNETFTTAATLQVSDDSVAGSWKVEVSNDYAPAGGGYFMQPPTSGHWTDITSALTPALAAVVPTTAATKNQWVQLAPFAFRAIRVTFTPTSGKSKVYVIIAGGEY